MTGRRERAGGNGCCTSGDGQGWERNLAARRAWRDSGWAGMAAMMLGEGDGTAQRKRSEASTAALQPDNCHLCPLGQAEERRPISRNLGVRSSGRASTASTSACLHHQRRVRPARWPPGTDEVPASGRGRNKTHATLLMNAAPHRQQAGGARCTAATASTSAIVCARRNASRQSRRRRGGHAPGPLRYRRRHAPDCNPTPRAPPSTRRARQAAGPSHANPSHLHSPAPLHSDRGPVAHYSSHLVSAGQAQVQFPLLRHA